jgi:hypothetical protein
MRYTGEARFRFSGDKKKAMLLIPEARKYMGILLNDSQFNGLQQAKRQWILGDGSIIQASKLFGMNTIDIYVPTSSPLSVSPESVDEYAYYFTLFKIDYPIAIDGLGALGENFDYIGNIDEYYNNIIFGDELSEPTRAFIIPHTRVIVTSDRPPPLDHPDVLQCFKAIYNPSTKLFLRSILARTYYTQDPEIRMVFMAHPYIYLPAIAYGPTIGTTPAELNLQQLLKTDIDESQEYWNRDHIPSIASIMGNRNIIDWCDCSHIDNNEPMSLAQLKEWMNLYNGLSDITGVKTVDNIVEIKEFKPVIQGYMTEEEITYEIPIVVESASSNASEGTPQSSWTYHHEIGGVGGNYDYFIGEYNQYEATVNDLISRGGIANSILDAGGLPKSVSIMGTKTQSATRWVVA